VHPRWYGLVRERRNAFCIHEGVLHAEAVRRATNMLGVNGPFLQCLIIRLGADLRAERRILGVPRDVLRALLLAAADAGCHASEIEELHLDLECADAAGMAAAVRIVEQNRGSLRRVALSVGERQLKDTPSASALGIVLGELRLERLSVRFVFECTKASAASDLVASVLDADASHVVVRFATDAVFNPIFEQCMQSYHSAREETDAEARKHRQSRVRRRLDIVFDDGPKNLMPSCIFLPLKLSTFHALRCDVGCRLLVGWRRTLMQWNSFEHSALREVVLNLFDVNMTKEIFTAVLDIVLQLPVLESFECDARENPINGEGLFDYHGAYVNPVNAAGIRRIRVRVPFRPGIRGADVEWNHWIRTACPLLGGCDGMIPEPCFPPMVPAKEPVAATMTDYDVSFTAERNATEAAERRAVLAQYRN
jgi:hypothetical protein